MTGKLLLARNAAAPRSRLCGSGVGGEGTRFTTEHAEDAEGVGSGILSLRGRATPEAISSFGAFYA